MSVKICFFEDSTYRNFFPIGYLRPVYAMRAGIVPLYERALRYFPGASISLAARQQVASTLAAAIPMIPVNIIKHENNDVLFINGRIRDYGNLAEQIEQAQMSTAFESGDEVVAVLFKDDFIKNIPAVAGPDTYLEIFKQNARDFPVLGCNATFFNYIWDLVAAVTEEIAADFESMRGSFIAPGEVMIHEDVHLLNDNDIYIGDTVRIYPDVVLNAENGPIYIGSNTIIEPQVTLNGPCFIGPNSIIYRGKISGSSIGHTCRVGGEIEESIFHSAVNKHHDGFIGHSYVGSWVNFGAMTTNSDLKNNYSNVRVALNGELLDTVLTKVGSFIGDHCKFGIGTLLNTGINVGPACNIFGGGLTIDKEIAPFQWGNSGKFQPFAFDKAIDIFRKVSDRRHTDLPEAEIELLREINEGVVKDDGILNFEFESSLHLE